MEAQLYEEGILRLFDGEGKKLCDMDITHPLKEESDKQLKRMRLRRRNKWTDYSWGSSAKIRFNL